MAVKYIYTPKTKSCDNDFFEREEEIREVVGGMFDENLKDIRVLKKGFEFTLYISVRAEILRELGRRLARVLNHSYHFVRQKQRMYAIVSEGMDGYRDVFLLDAELCELDSGVLEEQIKRHKMYRADLAEWVNRWNYIDMYTLQISQERYYALFKQKSCTDSFRGEELYMVTVGHSRIEYRSSESADEQFLRREDFDISSKFLLMEHLYTGDEHYEEYDDVVQIQVLECEKKAGMLDSLNAKLFSSGFLASIPEAPIDYLKEVFPEGKQEYTFKVHNVGQGLASSLALNELPEFYFDYGMACWPNKHTLPVRVDLSIARSAVIILSHLDEDHWCGFRKEKDALGATWIIPKQKKIKKFIPVITRIIYNGGQVFYCGAGKGLKSQNLIIGHSQKSSIKPTRLPSDSNTKSHETGFAMYLTASCSSRKRYIVVSGDQDYDYQEPRLLRDINLLVACHHGGKYCWSKKGTVPSSVSDNNLVVYSCGKGNTHSHPSKKADYISAGWKRWKETTCGDYEESIVIDF